MKTINQRELRNNSAAVMDAVEMGETYRIIRNGAEVAELRPVRRSRKLTAEQMVSMRMNLPRVDFTRLRADADEAFGPDDIDTDDPWAGRG